MSPRGIAAVATALLLVGAGCSGSDESESSGREDEALEGALSKVDEAAGGRDAPPQDEGERDATAEDALRQYFNLLNRHEYSKAWAMLDESVRAQFGGFDAWVDGYKTTESTRLVAVERTDRSRAFESFRVEIRAVDSGPCDEALVRGFEGPWTLERRGKKWIVTAATFGQISGNGSASCGGTAPVYYTDAAYQLVEQPAALQVDNHDLLVDLTWSNWGAPSANGSGTLQHRICDPNCADGYDVQLAATVTMSDIADCGGVRQYRTLTIAFEGTSPDGITGPASVANAGAC